MSLREEFVVAIRCPGCGQYGSTVWEETAASHRSQGPQRRLKIVSAGFVQGSVNPVSRDPCIICDNCEAILPD
jgi:uncharacterized ferredoxin-like protein